MGKPRSKRSKRDLETLREEGGGIDRGIARARKLLTVMDKGDAIGHLVGEGWRQADAFLVVSAAIVIERSLVRS